MKYIVICITLLLTYFNGNFLAEASSVPYYASIKDDEANIRTGPSVKYPIRWVYHKKNWPVKIVATFEGWRRIEDAFGEVGWIHSTLLTGKRHVVINSNGAQEVLRNPISTSKVNFIIENGVVAKLEYCKNSWCQIEAEELSGWVEEKSIWGVK